MRLAVERGGVESQVLEPSLQTQVGPRPSSEGTTTLPDDLLTEQSIRIQLLYGLGVLLWLLNFVMDVGFAPNGDRGPYRLLIEGLAAVMSAGVAAFTRFSHSSHRTKVTVGVACMVPHAFALALLNSWTVHPTTERPVSGVTVLILLFGMMAPARPGKMLAAALVAASMDPLGVWIAHLRGLPVPPFLQTVLMFYPNYACAVLAVVPARVLYRLGRKLREARALGSYQLIERLGEGGMGEVWLARHRLLARHAAVKLVRPEMLGGSAGEAANTLRRFEREAQATAALSSPHTIRLYDFGLTDRGTFYYVMELLDGRDLESLVDDFGPLSPARALYLLGQVCQSLAEAHAKGLIHRDIKPANIYVCRMGIEYDYVKVLDFGLVKMADRSTASTLLTAEPEIMGTPAYMAPEVILGDAFVDHRLDIYAIGCVAYYLLTGDLVFAGPTRMKLLMQHVQDVPLPPSLRARQPIPPEIDELVLSCLHKDPRRRPSAEALLQQLAACWTMDLWDQRSAKAWWEQHLPDLARQAPVMIPRSDPGARALAASLL